VQLLVIILFMFHNVDTLLMYEWLMNQRREEWFVLTVLLSMT